MTRRYAAGRRRATVFRRRLGGDAVPAAVYLAHAAVFRAAPLGAFHVDLTDFEAPSPVIELCPESVARENLLLPLALRDGALTFALHNPDDHWLIQRLQFILNRDLEVVAAPALQLAAAIERNYGPSTTGEVLTPHFLGSGPGPSGPQ